jgi:hypothetical protein
MITFSSGCYQEVSFMTLFDNKKLSATEENQPFFFFGRPLRGSLDFILI